MSINKDCPNHHNIKVFKDDAVFLHKIQPYLRNYIIKNPNYNPALLEFIDFQIPENSQLLEHIHNIFFIFSLLSNYSFDIQQIPSVNESIKIAKSVMLKMPLEDFEWDIIRQQIKSTIDDNVDIDEIERSFFIFLQALSSINQPYAESIYISLYNSTSLYSGKILHEMYMAKLPFGYRELINKVITVKNPAIKRKYIHYLFTYYPEKQNQTTSREIILSLNYCTSPKCAKK